MKRPKQYSPSLVRKKIKELERIDLIKADVELLKDKITYLLKGYGFATPILMPGWKLFRGVKCVEKPSNVSQITYPNSKIIKKYQRVNRPGNATFYSSIAREAPFYELDMNPNEFIAISRWGILEKIVVNNVGYHQDSFKQLGSNREAPIFGEGYKPTTSDLIVNKYFANEFAKVVPEGGEHLYKISVAISEKLCGGELHMEIAGDSYKGPMEIGGVIYPTIAMRANSDNIALKTHIVDKYLSLEQVEYIRVDSTHDFQYEVKIIDFANSFCENGTIEWKGRHPQWVLGPGQEVTVSVENGHYVARDTEGNIIEPT